MSSPAIARQTAFLEVFDNATPEQLLRVFKWMGIALAAAICAGSYHWLNPDYMSYLDIGEAWLRGDFAHAANGYWNPVFPILAAGFAKLFPNNEWDSLAGHILNFLIYLGAQATFIWLLRQTQEFISGSTTPSRPLILFGGPLFIWCELFLTSPRAMHADTIVGITLMGGAGMVLRILSRGGTLRRYAALGAILGFGYLTKAIMLSISSGFFFAALFLCKPFARALRWTVAAGLIFVAINAPHVLYLSKLKGRLDLGDTGPLAYAWLVNDVSPLFHWTGEPPEFGTPVHGPKKLLNDPEVFDYTSYPYGTFPPGYDPSYWNEGLKPRPNIRDQLSAIKEGLGVYARILIRPTPALLLLALAVALRGASMRQFFTNLRPLAALLLPSAIGLTMYLLVLVDLRYVAYLLLLPFLALFAAALKSTQAKPGRALEVLSLAALLIISATLSRDALAAQWGGNNQRFHRDQIKIARMLKEHGLKPGDPIGMLGRACEASFARIAELKILAEGCTFHHDDRWLSDPAKRERAVQAMLPLNLRAIVLQAAPANLGPEWTVVPGADYAIRFEQ